MHICYPRDPITLAMAARYSSQLELRSAFGGTNEFTSPAADLRTTSRFVSHPAASICRWAFVLLRVRNGTHPRSRYWTRMHESNMGG